MPTTLRSCSSWRIRGNVLVVVLLLLSIAPLNAHQEEEEEEEESNYYLRRRAAAAVRPSQRIKPKRNHRGGNRGRRRPNNSTAALDKVRDNHRVKRGNNNLDSIRAQSPHLVSSSGNTRPRDIPNVPLPAANSNNNNATEPDADAPEDESSPAIRPARPHDMPNPFDNTKTLDDLIQDLFANEPPAVTQDQPAEEAEEMPEEQQTDNNNATEVPPTLNDRPIMSNETKEAGGDIDFSNNDPIVFLNNTLEEEEEEDMDIQFAAAPAFKPNVCGANATEARATCASLPSCSRISSSSSNSTECYKECNMFNPTECGEGRRCVPFVGGCMGFAFLPDDIDDNLFTRITFDERPTTTGGGGGM